MSEKKQKTQLKQKQAESSRKPQRYFEGIGRRKTAIARVRISSGSNSFFVNDKKPQEYFTMESLLRKIYAPFQALKTPDHFTVSIKVSGSGLSAQAEAVRHGLARALADFNPDFKKTLRQTGFLTRDPRMVERKKYGYKKARRAPQWAKR